jgi:general secretion pathway protein C
LGKLNSLVKKMTEKKIGGDFGDFTQSSFQISRRATKKIERYYGYAFAVFLAYLVADLTVLGVRDRFFPTSAPAPRVMGYQPTNQKMIAEYDAVTRRNIFNSDGVIPPALSAGAKKDEIPDELGPATLSDLPMVLIGTIVHMTKGKSVATIEIKSGTSKVLPFFPNDDIEGLATLLKVERKRAIFRNNRNSRLEYIEIKDESTLTFGMKAKQPGEISQEGENNFSISRTDLNEYMKNLPDLLQQATAIPNISPTTGRIDGFKVIDMMPNSLFSKLGIQKDDLIRGVNGEPIDSPAKAMELYNKLRNERNIQLDIDRRGRAQTLNFNVN